MRFYPTPYTRELVEEWIEESINRYQSDGFGLWAVELKTTGELVAIAVRRCGKFLGLGRSSSGGT